MKLGIDIGSVSAKVVVLDNENQVVETHYVRTHGQPLETALGVLEGVLSKYRPNCFNTVAATGTGGKLVAELLGIQFVNEIFAQSAGTSFFHPAVKAIIEIGGEDSKLIFLKSDDSQGLPKVVDFVINGICAAGTGSFLDQQASRLGIPIEQFGEVAQRSAHPPRIAGRCSVFAKTDMIHLQQIGTPVHDVVAGLCFALVGNFKANVVRSRQLDKPVCFQGGVAANQGIKRALLEMMALQEGELIVPAHFAMMGAIGAVLIAGENKPQAAEKAVLNLGRIKEYLGRRRYEFASLPPLQGDGYPICVAPSPMPEEKKIEIYVGVDVGSISTNVVAIDREGNVLARRYLMTAGRPIEAVRKGLFEVGQELGGRGVVKGAGSTGSGRYLTGEFFGADTIRDEITSHAKAAAFMCPGADTIFEIGGQDAKYISLENGAVVDFAMNKVCAAGTGSFLEEQAEKLAVRIDGEFGDMALASQRPLDLGERCTVFMESQLNFHKQKGAAKEDLVGGLAYSVVKNYLSKVVEDRRIGNQVLFQGGVAYNRGVKAAFENVLGQSVTVPPHHDLLGAIGVAMLAREEMEAKGGQTRFRGFDLMNTSYELSSFECQDCPNCCEINEIVFEAGSPRFYGSRCGKYDRAEKKERRQTAGIPRLFEERHQALMNAYPKDSPDLPNGKSVGIARALFFHELFPLWKAFFTELGFRVVVSDPTSRGIIRNGVANVVEEPCFPIKVAYGHVLNLLDKGVDFLFLPVQCTMERLSDDFEKSWNCPLTQSFPFMARSSGRIQKALASGVGPKILNPVFHADRGRSGVAKALRCLAREIGVSGQAGVSKAIQAGFKALDGFNVWQQKRGQEVLAQLTPGDKAIVLIGRPYNTADPGLTLNLPEKLRELGVLAIPLDFLPLKDFAKEVFTLYPNMYWGAGQKILAAAEMIANDPRLFGLYLTNFGCGADSYVTKFFSKMVSGKPFLTIEIDEHSADAGIITRCEAFISTMRHARTRGTSQPVPTCNFIPAHTRGRTVYIPYMLDHGSTVAAAMRRAGTEAEALPQSDELTLKLGRKYTSGRECYPSVITTGDIVKKALSSGFDPKRAAFFMPGASGPCRFGQYNKLHRLVLDELGLAEVPIVVFDQTKNFHRHLASLGPSFWLTTWMAIGILDQMQKTVLERRPYEINQGETDALYQEWLGLLIKRLEQSENGLEEFSRRAGNAFKAVKIDRSFLKPRIGIVGEIFVRCNSFANDFVVRRLEALGAQCSLPPFTEWLDYIGHQRKRRYRLGLEGSCRDYIRELLTGLMQKMADKRIRRSFEGAGDNSAQELPIPEIIKRGEAYLCRDIEGEAILSMGRAVEYAEKGYNGILNIMPFGCMPGIVISAMLHQFSAQYGLPVLNMVVDGNKDPGAETRLEAFFHQCCQHMGRTSRLSRERNYPD